MNTNQLLDDIRSACRFFRDIADPANGDYNLDHALQRVFILAGSLIALDRALSFGVPLPIAWTKNRGVEVTEPLSRIPDELRALAARLVDDNDDTPEDAAEQGCELAQGVLDLDAVLALADTNSPDHLDAAHEAAIEAARALVESYRRGKADGGFTEWSDVDVAHEHARRALLHLARHRRLRRRD